VGSYVQPDLERNLALQPDLCLGTTDGTPAPLVARLEDLKVPVLLVHPRSLEEVVLTVEHIGRVLGAEARADSLAAELRERIRRVRERVAAAPTRPRVFFQIGVTPLVAVGEGTFIHELIVTAGGRNMIKGPAPYPQVGLEQVLAGRPEVIIVTTMAKGVDMDRVLAGWQSYPALPAVRRRRVHAVDSDLFDRPGPRLVEGLETLARLLHPELGASDGNAHGPDGAAPEDEKPPLEGANPPLQHKVGGRRPPLMGIFT
jgi:iron complex transport system substrate-binding protein